MDIRQSPLLLGIYLGNWFGTSVRVSVWFPLLLVALCVRLEFTLGLTVSAILFFSILFHEFFHIFAVRATGGQGNEILMWPLGGLAFVSPAATFRSEIWTPAAGPISNAILCLVTLPAVVNGGLLSDSLDLLYLPPVNLALTPLTSVLVLTFAVNFKLMILNLLPIYPLDGGQMAFVLAKLKWPAEAARVGSLWVGGLLCMVVAMAGFMLELSDLVFLGFLLMTLTLQEFFLYRRSETYEESFLGYDFSQGYTSLERSAPAEPEERRPGALQRWQAQRAAKRKEREERERIETERKLDVILEKVHQSGIESLSDSERRFLNRASAKYRRD